MSDEYNSFLQSKENNGLWNSWFLAIIIRDTLLSRYVLQGQFLDIEQNYFRNA